MELFIDAYDWFMVPNVYAMSQYAMEEISRPSLLERFGVYPQDE